MEREKLVELRQKGMSIRGIAGEVGLSYTTIRYWMRYYGLDCSRVDQRARLGPHCRVCGETRPALFYKKPQTECKKCFNRRRAKQNQRNRAVVVQTLGGRCSICGYARCEAALELHHRDPSGKDPKYRATKNSSIDVMLAEARKCVLVCSNCHRELHSGIASLPL
jgi:hypothetical protein